jgi:hypothetical protein
VRQARDKIASYRIDLVELRLALGGLMLCCAALGLFFPMNFAVLALWEGESEKTRDGVAGQTGEKENERLVTIYH